MNRLLSLPVTLLALLTTALLLVAHVATPPRAAAEEWRGLVTTGTFDWPLVPRPHVSRKFDKPEHNWLSGHRGVDLAGYPGQAVLAAGAGIVVFAGVVAGKPVVSVDHPGGLRTTYEPVEPRVTAGMRVGQGTVLGYLEPGHQQCSAPSGTCLHWGLRRGREYLDPTVLVRAMPIRLLPTR
ncbi:MAG: M23 family metallopeptidase [Rhodococcus sp.]|nr:M23 family metallopeptidase [Rhodococcus sp. (in: high G+C Gram-positive bacteria)]